MRMPSAEHWSVLVLVDSLLEHPNAIGGKGNLNSVPRINHRWLALFAQCLEPVWVFEVGTNPPPNWVLNVVRCPDGPRWLEILKREHFVHVGIVVNQAVFGVKLVKVFETLSQTHEFRFVVWVRFEAVVHPKQNVVNPFF